LLPARRRGAEKQNADEHEDRERRLKASGELEASTTAYEAPRARVTPKRRIRCDGWRVGCAVVSEEQTPNRGALAGIARLGDAAAKLAHAVVPDPFVIAILLGALALVIGWLFGDKSLPALMESYAGGMLSQGLIAFAFQMALILVTGHALAAAPIVKRALQAIADVPKTPAAAAAVVALTAMLLAFANWGLGLVGGAFVAREVGRAFARRGQPLNYPLIGAAGYTGLLVWHGGFSGSAPLKVASEGPFGAAIDSSLTIGSGMNLAVTATILVVIPALFALLAQGPNPVDVQPSGLDDDEPVPLPQSGRIHVVENAVVVMALLAVPILYAVGTSIADKGFFASLNLNFIILLFFALGLAMHRSVMSYSSAFADGSRSAAGILLQFPLYFGILAVAKDSGVVVAMARGLSELSVQLSGVLSAQTSASWFTFLSAAIVNMLVPSGGGQWALQSPIIAETASNLSLDRARLVMAFSYGDQLTNMLQPFWALPLLSITGLRAREILGYTMIAMCVATPVFLLWLAAM
jgi:short-chain fatty acids transporter